MKQIVRPFTSHPSSVGESYFQHMGTAFGFGWNMLTGGLACLIHGIFPFLCVKTGSRRVTELHHRMVTHRDKRQIDDAPNARYSNEASSNA